MIEGDHSLAAKSDGPDDFNDLDGDDWYEDGWCEDD